MADRRPEQRQPWLKFYSSAWRADVPLRICSFAARGLWVDLLSLMHESATYGFLLIERVNPSAKQLAGLLGGSEREVRALLAELGHANVYSVTGKAMPDDVAALIPQDMQPGVILSRRMLRDKAKANCDRLNGKEGGNPRLRGSGANGLTPQPTLRGESEDFGRGGPTGLPLTEKPTLVAAREGHEGPSRDAVRSLITGATASLRVPS